MALNLRGLRPGSVVRFEHDLDDDGHELRCLDCGWKTEIPEAGPLGSIRKALGEAMTDHLREHHPKKPAALTAVLSFKGPPDEEDPLPEPLDDEPASPTLVLWCCSCDRTLILGADDDLDHSRDTCGSCGDSNTLRAQGSTAYEHECPTCDVRPESPCVDPYKPRDPIYWRLSPHPDRDPENAETVASAPCPECSRAAGSPCIEVVPGGILVAGTAPLGRPPHKHRHALVVDALGKPCPSCKAEEGESCVDLDDNPGPLHEARIRPVWIAVLAGTTDPAVIAEVKKALAEGRSLIGLPAGATLTLPAGKSEPEPGDPLAHACPECGAHPGRKCEDARYVEIEGEVHVQRVVLTVICSICVVEAGSRCTTALPHPERVEAAIKAPRRGEVPPKRRLIVPKPEDDHTLVDCPNCKARPGERCTLPAFTAWDCHSVRQRHAEETRKTICPFCDSPPYALCKEEVPAFHKERRRAAAINRGRRSLLRLIKRPPLKDEPEPEKEPEDPRARHCSECLPVAEGGPEPCCCPECLASARPPA